NTPAIPTSERSTSAVTRKPGGYTSAATTKPDGSVDWWCRRRRGRDRRKMMRTLIVLALCLLPQVVATVPAASSNVPLGDGLTIVTAITQPEGDYESIKTIESVASTGVRLKYSTEHVARDLPGHPLEKLNVMRSIRVADLKSANKYLQEFGPSIPIEA